MKKILSLILFGVCLASSGCREDSFDASSIRPETLTEIIGEKQKQEVRESSGVWSQDCFSDDDLNEFVETDRAAKIAQALKKSKRFQAVVEIIKNMPAGEQQAFLNSCRRALRPTWREIGSISREGQTEAGNQAELLIAQAIVDLVKELIEFKF
jgi:hypothetical protein